MNPKFRMGDRVKTAEFGDEELTIVGFRVDFPNVLVARHGPPGRGPDTLLVYDDKVLEAVPRDTGMTGRWEIDRVGDVALVWDGHSENDQYPAGGVATISIAGQVVPHVKATFADYRDSRLEQPLPDDQFLEREYMLVVDDRLAWPVSRRALFETAEVIANAMAVAAGFSSFGRNSRLMNPYLDNSADTPARIDPRACKCGCGTVRNGKQTDEVGDDALETSDAK